MKFKDLSPEAIEKINGYRYDCIIEKHEGPESWSSFLRYYDPEFVQIDEYDVLLPVSRKDHPNITVLRTIVGDDGESLTLFLKDTTYITNPDEEMFFSGFMAVCDRIPNEEFYLAVVYHEWFIIDNQF